MTMVQVDLPEGAFSALHSDPAEMSVNMRQAAAVKWYEMRWISQEKAAQIAGVSRSEFIQLLQQFQVSPFQYTEEEIEQELRQFT